MNPCGDPPGGVGVDAHAADRGGRRAAQPGPAHDRRSAVARRRRSRASIPAPARRCPTTRSSCSSRPERAPDHRLRPPQPVPHHGPAGHERDLGRRRRLEHLGGDQPPRQPDRRRRRQLRLALLRGPGPRVGYDGANLNICENLYAAGSSAVVAPSSPTTTATRSCPARRCPAGSSSVSGLAFYTRRQLPGQLRRRALLRRLLAQLHLGDAGGRERPADPATRLDLRRRRGRPGRPRDRPRRRPLLRRLRRGTIRRIRYFAGNQAAGRDRAREPAERAVPLTVHFDGRSSSDPEGGHAHVLLGSRRRRHLRRLDGGAAVASRTRRRRRSPCGSASPTARARPRSARSS